MGNATSIEPQSIDYSPSHQNALDQVEQAAKGLWHWLENLLPEHPQKDDALNAVKQAYDNAAKVIKDIAEKEFNDARAQAAAAGTELVENAEAAGEAVVQGVEQAAAGVAGSVTPTASVPAASTTASSGAPESAEAPATDTPTK